MIEQSVHTIQDYDVHNEQFLAESEELVLMACLVLHPSIKNPC
jgi:hypothetical protein